jgi:cytochrome c
MAGALCCAGPLAAEDLDARLAAANLKRGQLLFLVCKACHDVEAGLPHKVGPNLHGVFGRKAGTAEGFRYTPALAGADVTWSAATLDTFLKQPGAMVPGNGMAFAGIANDADRASLIAWLMASSGAP